MTFFFLLRIVSTVVYHLTCKSDIFMELISSHKSFLKRHSVNVFRSNHVDCLKLDTVTIYISSHGLVLFISSQVSCLPRDRDIECVSRAYGVLKHCNSFVDWLKPNWVIDFQNNAQQFSC